MADARSMADAIGTRIAGEVFWRKDGTCFPVAYTSYPVLDSGAIGGAVVAFQDISDLERREKEREVFLHAISHDLRQPLASIQGHAEVLRLWLEREGTGAKPLKSANTITRNSKLMGTMIQQLVDAARLDAGKLSVSPVAVDLVAFVHEQLEQIPDAPPAKFDINVPEALPSVRADPVLLRRIFDNLLSNALKYSPSDAKVGVSLRLKDGGVETSVSDRGSGIPADDLPHIFEQYYRSQDLDQQQKEGLGLGLFIARRLIEAMGGRITVASKLGVGTTFSFILPGCDPAAGQPEGC